MAHRDIHVLTDPYGMVKAHFYSHPDHEPEVPPWVTEHIQHKGWVLRRIEEKQELPVMHGQVNWQQIADGLAGVVRVLLSDEEEWSEENDEIIEQAQQALDDYNLAHMEIGIGRVGSEEEPDGEG